MVLEAFLFRVYLKNQLQEKRTMILYFVNFEMDQMRFMQLFQKRIVDL